MSGYLDNWVMCEYCGSSFPPNVHGCPKRIAALEAEVAELRKVIAPFATVAIWTEQDPAFPESLTFSLDGWRTSLTVRDVRRAKQKLATIDAARGGQ